MVDELTLKVLLAELGPVLAGAAALSAYRPAPGIFALELRTRDGRRGALTLVPRDGGAMFFGDAPGKRRGERVRAGLEDAELVAAEQWQDDRLVVFDFAVGGGRRRLVAEFFGRAGGLFVLEDDAVAAVLSGRPLATGEEYPWPTGRRRAPAGSLSRGDVSAYAAARDARALTREVAYMSPWAARAIVGDGGEEAAARRFGVFARAAAAGDVRPVAVSAEGVWRPFPCDIFDAVCFDEVRTFESANAAAAFAYAENERAGDFVAAGKALERRLLANVRRLERQRKALERNRDEYAEYDRYRRMGEALKYNLAAVRRGATTVTLPDPYGEGDIEIELRPELPPVANAERLFTRYKKAKRGVEAVAARLKAVDEELARVRDDLERVRAATDLAELEPWLGKTREGDGSKREPAARAGPGRRFLSSEGLLILVGRSAAENDELTFKYARPHDLWLHAEQAHGSHVIVRRPDKNKAVPRRTLEEAAALAAFYSSDKHAGVVPVVVVERRHVRRAKGPAGRVTHRGGDVVFAEPRANLKPAS
jgi:predicted ribosome quality control (RQC) complex YloA/Tae2 family protein